MGFSSFETVIFIKSPFLLNFEKLAPRLKTQLRIFRPKLSHEILPIRILTYMKVFHLGDGKNWALGNQAKCRVGKETSTRSCKGSGRIKN